MSDIDLGTMASDDLDYCDCGHTAIMHRGWIERRTPVECFGMRLHTDRSITNCKCRQFAALGHDAAPVVS